MCVWVQACITELLLQVAEAETQTMVQHLEINLEVMVEV